MWWPAIGGLVVGLGGLIEPRALGVGYDDHRRSAARASAGTGRARAAAGQGGDLVDRAGSGTSGGVLAPLLIMGGALGAADRPLCCPAAQRLWALLGMAAMMGGTMRAPLTGTLFAVELTGDCTPCCRCWPPAPPPMP